MTYYGQNLEDKTIHEYFGERVGKFIDIGAFDVFKLSNTRALYEHGWSGVLVEPAPSNFKNISEHYSGDARIEVLNFAVGVTDKDLTFFDSGGDAVSTSVERHRDLWAGGGVTFTEIKVKQVNVHDFMNQYAKDSNFISIDTEATNYELFKNIPDWVWKQIDMLCIEHDNRWQEIESKLQGFGFKKILWNAENIIMAK